MFYFGVRYYDADVGRWVSTDPAEWYSDLYLYSGNNPINRIDPDGLWDGFLFVEGEAAAFTGVTVSAGGVIDTDDPSESGVFVSGSGLDKTLGAGYGVAIGVGFAVREVEGKSTGIDFNLLGLSGTVSFYDQGFAGIAITVGPGIGGVVAETKTETYSGKDLERDYNKVNESIVEWCIRKMSRRYGSVLLILPKEIKRKHDILKFVIFPLGSIILMLLSAIVSEFFAILFVIYFFSIAYLLYEIKCPHCGKRVVRNKVFLPKRCKNCGYKLYC